jgi:hypothetical protein
MAGQSEADAVKHNLASDLMSLGYKNSAALLWESIYRDKPDDELIRRGLHMLLMRFVIQVTRRQF